MLLSSWWTLEYVRPECKCVHFAAPNYPRLWPLGKHFISFPKTSKALRTPTWQVLLSPIEYFCLSRARMGRNSTHTIRTIHLTISIFPFFPFFPFFPWLISGSWHSCSSCWSSVSSLSSLSSQPPSPPWPTSPSLPTGSAAPGAALCWALWPSTDRATSTDIEL